MLDKRDWPTHLSLNTTPYDWDKDSCMLYVPCTPLSVKWWCDRIIGVEDKICAYVFTESNDSNIIAPITALATDVTLSTHMCIHHTCSGSFISLPCTPLRTAIRMFFHCNFIWSSSSILCCSISIEICFKSAFSYMVEDAEMQLGTVTRGE